MESLTQLLAYLLAVAGATVLLVWPEHGPTAMIRDGLIRPHIPMSMTAVLDCYVCASVWLGLALSPVAYLLFGQPWCLIAWLAPPALFWLVTGSAESS